MASVLLFVLSQQCPLPGLDGACPREHGVGSPVPAPASVLQVTPLMAETVDSRNRCHAPALKNPAQRKWLAILA